MQLFYSMDALDTVFHRVVGLLFVSRSSLASFLNAEDGLLNAEILIVLSNDLELREKLSTAISFKSYQKLIKLCSNQGPNSTKTKQKKKTKTNKKVALAIFALYLFIT